MDPVLDQFTSLQAIHLRQILILSYYLLPSLPRSLMIGSFAIFAVNTASFNNLQNNQPTKGIIKRHACMYERDTRDNFL